MTRPMTDPLVEGGAMEDPHSPVEVPRNLWTKIVKHAREGDDLYLRTLVERASRPMVDPSRMPCLDPPCQGYKRCGNC